MKKLLIFLMMIIGLSSQVYSQKKCSGRLTDVICYSWTDTCRIFVENDKEIMEVSYTKSELKPDKYGYVPTRMYVTFDCNRVISRKKKQA